MVDLSEIKRKRFLFLNRLYEITEGNEYSHVNKWRLGQGLGFESNETKLITQYLKGEGLIEYTTLDGGISITHFGVLQVEEAISNPEKPTYYFPPVTNIINIQKMVNSQIQQGTTHSTQTGSFNSQDLQSLADFINLLRGKLPELNLKPEDKKEVEADIETIEAQLSSPKPKSVIIKECLGTIRNILEGITGSILASGLCNMLGAFFN